jgi:hypothetical protein
MPFTPPLFPPSGALRRRFYPLLRLTQQQLLAKPRIFVWKSPAELASLLPGEPALSAEEPENTQTIKKPKTNKREKFKDIELRQAVNRRISEISRARDEEEDPPLKFTADVRPKLFKTESPLARSTCCLRLYSNHV